MTTQVDSSRRDGPTAAVRTAGDTEATKRCVKCGKDKPYSAFAPRGWPNQRKVCGRCLGMASALTRKLRRDGDDAPTLSERMPDAPVAALVPVRHDTGTLPRAVVGIDPYCPRCRGAVLGRGDWWVSWSYSEGRALYWHALCWEQLLDMMSVGGEHAAVLARMVAWGEGR